MVQAQWTAASISFYEAIAPAYDLLQPFSLNSFEEQLTRRVQALIANRIVSSPAALASAQRRSVLDLGCGTGTLLHGLRAAHPDWRLCGVDASPAMLARAKAKPGSGSIIWTRGDLGRTLPFARGFDLVGAFNDTLSHLPDLEALASTFRAAADVMEPAGILVFDVTNGSATEPSRITIPGLDGKRVSFEQDYDAVTRIRRLVVTLVDGATNLSCSLARRWFSDPEVEHALRQAGLTVEVSAPWSPFTKDTPTSTWYVARLRH